MTDEQKFELARIRQYLADIIGRGDPHVILATSECQMLIGWVEGLEGQNANWKEQCGRLIKLIDRIDKDMAQEMLIYRTKTT